MTEKIKFKTVQVPEPTKQKLKALSEKSGLSQAAMLELMCDYFARCDFTVTQQHASIQVKSDLGIPTTQGSEQN